MNRTTSIIVFGFLGAVTLFLLIGFFWFRGMNNTMVEKEESVKQQVGNLDGAYQRRADLVPNIVATVKEATEAEQEALASVVQARARATGVQLTADALKDPEAMENFMAAQKQLGSSLSRLLAVTENYPQLQSQAGYRDLRVTLEGTENRIAVERRKYNEMVGAYNKYIKKFPQNIVANMLGFDEYAYFEADKGAEKAPDVQSQFDK